MNDEEPARKNDEADDDDSSQPGCPCVEPDHPPGLEAHAQWEREVKQRIWQPEW
jgi:hypothetical protein